MLKLSKIIDCSVFIAAGTVAEYVFCEGVIDFSEKPPRIQLDEDLITCNKSLFMKYIGVYITYISATVIKRENFMQLSNYEKYFGTYFLHAHLVFDMLRDNNSKIVVTKDAYLAAKNNNSGGFDLYEVWIRQYKNLLLETAVKNGFDRKLMK